MKKMITLFLLAITFTANAADGLFDFLKNKNGPPSSEQLIIFYRSGCPYCENMSKVLEKENDFIGRLEEKFSVRKIDITTDEGRLLADQFNVHAVPSTVRFNGLTGESAVIKGFPGVQRFAAFTGLDYRDKIIAQQISVDAKIETIDNVIPLPAKDKFAACGDGIINGGEQCDDGNLANGDGCSATCTIQPGFVCSGSPSVCSPVCGDGLRVGTEQCDDGNTTNGDGCSSTCTVQPGFVCVGSGPGSCSSICGDGIRVGSETCDDGNTVNGDGCGSTCSVESGFTCVGQPSVCSVSAVCGDGVIQSGETCDDGNTTNGDGCSATCQVQSGFLCFGQPSVCTSICGDGIVAGAEACDDGNTANGDGCGSTCNVESGFTCTGSPSVCTGPPVNDNCSGAISLSGTSGTINGNNSNATNASPSIPVSCASTQKDLWYKFTLGSATFINIRVNHGTLADPAVAVYSGSCGALTQVLCHDDIAGAGDRDAVVTGTLPAGTYFVRMLGYNTGGTFTLIYNLTGAGCGDNIVQAGEECDDGNVVPNDGCSSTCTFENTAGIKGVAVNLDATRPAPSALLDVKSNDRGVLIPRMSSTERTAIASPAKSLLVFDITTNSFWYFKTGTGWTEIASSGNNIGFGASNVSNQALGSNFIPSFTEQYDDGNNFATTIFTAPQTGVYNFSSVITFTLTASVSAYVISAEIRHPTLATQYGANSVIVPANFAGTITLNISANTKLPASTPVGMAIFKTGAGNQTISSITFNGFKVY